MSNVETLPFSVLALAFETGTVVYLKSGSPPLTVSDVRVKPNIVTVDWFDVDAYAMRGEFHKDQLTLSAGPVQKQWETLRAMPIKEEP